MLLLNASSILMIVLIFITDLLSPQYFAHGSLFIIPIALAWIARGVRMMWCVSALSIFLTWLAFGLTFSDHSLPFTVANRLISSGVIVVLTMVFHRFLLKERSLEQKDEELISQYRFLNAVVNGMDEGVIVFNTEGHVILQNRMAIGFFDSELCLLPITQWPEAFQLIEAQGSKPLPGDQFPIYQSFQSGAYCEGEFMIRNANYPQGAWLEMRAFPIFDPSGEIELFVSLFSNCTDTKELERQKREFEDSLHQARKLEAVGQLTGGIAHDFNNLLTVIVGNASILESLLPSDSNTKSLVMETRAAAEHAAELTHRLLAFSRKQTLEPRMVYVNDLIANMRTLFLRTLGEQIEIQFIFKPDLPELFVDPSQLESAVLNLAINARDAMPNGGVLTIETQTAVLDEAYAARHNEVTAGEYVMIAVSDNGEGMSPEVKERAFEPFFTTKPQGRGTGMGLSMVFGFVKQSKGHIKIYSEAGEGTSIKMYFPIQKVDAAVPDAIPESHPIPRGEGETILLVEDDGMVRAYACRVLSKLGYKVIEAGSGPEALDKLQSNRVQLLFTDVIMPGGMNGAELAEHARKIDPSLRVLYTSGYTENAIAHQGRLDSGVILIAKPYSIETLADKIRQALESVG